MIAQRSVAIAGNNREGVFGLLFAIRRRRSAIFYYMGLFWLLATEYSLTVLLLLSDLVLLFWVYLAR